MSVEKSIIEELLAENVQLRKKLSEITELSGFTSHIHILEEKPQLKISGVLIAEGVWKGVKYDFEEMCKALDKFQGLPIKVMHGHSEEFGDRNVGKVIKVAKDPILRAIVFEGIITDDRAAELVKDGTFNAISIKGAFKEISNDVPPVGRDYTPMEASLTGSPACDNCYIFNVEELSKSLKESNKADSIGEKEMSEVEEVEIKEDQVLIVPENFSELKEGETFEFEIKSLDEILKEVSLEEGEGEAKEVKKIKKVIIRVPPGKYPKTAKYGVKIYGYPYPKYAYPYYYYYGYGYPYSRPGIYYYYYYPEVLEEILDTVIENESYREFMKECMKEKGGGPEALKECAKLWREKKKEQSEDVLEQECSECNEELATIKCPVCGKEFSSKQAFLKHWKEEHEEKYGAYQLIKRLIKEMQENKAFLRRFRHIIELQKESTEEKKETKQEQTNTEKQEETKEETKEESKESKETSIEETKEESKEISEESKTEESKESEETKETKEGEKKEIKIEATPETVAELILKEFRT